MSATSLAPSSNASIDALVSAANGSAATAAARAVPFEDKKALYATLKDKSTIKALPVVAEMIVTLEAMLEAAQADSLEDALAFAAPTVSLTTDCGGLATATAFPDVGAAVTVTEAPPNKSPVNARGPRNDLITALDAVNAADALAAGSTLPAKVAGSPDMLFAILNDPESGRRTSGPPVPRKDIERFGSFKGDRRRRSGRRGAAGLGPGRRRRHPVPHDQPDRLPGDRGAVL